MKTRLLFVIIWLVFTSCVFINEKVEGISQLSKSYCVREYQAYKQSVAANNKIYERIVSENLFDFLDNFSLLYSRLYRDVQLAAWLQALGIGDAGQLAQAGKNRNNFVNANGDMFWKLHGNTPLPTKEQERRVRLWEKIFQIDKDNSGGKGSGEIIKEINEIEHAFLKIGDQDIRVLLDQEEKLKKLFALRNQFARIKGFQNHLHYIFSLDEVNEYTEINNTLLDNLPSAIADKHNVGGLSIPKRAEYLMIMKRCLQGMGFTIDENKIRYYITDNYTYKKTFMSIIEPKNECRIYIFIPDFSLYPDEYLFYLSSLMHETGHALHFQYTNTEPFIFNFFDTTVTETMAILFGNIVYKEEWIKKYFPQKLTDEEIKIIIQNRKKSIMEFFRYAIFLWMFEKSVYMDPSQDIGELYKTLTRKVNMPKSSQYKLWYDTSIFASHDLYYVHYALAYLYAFKLETLLAKKYGERFFENPEAGKMLVEYIFRYGNSLDRKELFTRIFGDNELPIKEYIAYLTSME